LLIFTLLIGLLGSTELNTQNYVYAEQTAEKSTVENDAEISSFSAKTTKKATPTTTTKPTPTTKPVRKPTPTAAPTKQVELPQIDIKNTNLSKYNKIYPYADIEKPAKLQGLKFELQDNVEFLPEDTSYDVEDAPVASYTSEEDTEGLGSQAGIPNFQIDLSNDTQRTYQPGTSLLKFRDRSVVPQKGKIYIDSNTQSSYMVIDDAVTSSSGVEAAVVKPRAEDVFKSIYIPRQEIRLTKGNITDVTEGVTYRQEQYCGER
jgi:hypothetical protein